MKRHFSWRLQRVSNGIVDCGIKWPQRIGKPNESITHVSLDYVAVLLLAHQQKTLGAKIRGNNKSPSRRFSAPLHLTRSAQPARFGGLFFALSFLRLRAYHAHAKRDSSWTARESVGGRERVRESPCRPSTRSVLDFLRRCKPLRAVWHLILDACGVGNTITGRQACNAVTQMLRKLLISRSTLGVSIRC